MLCEREGCLRAAKIFSYLKHDDRYHSTCTKHKVKRIGIIHFYDVNLLNLYRLKGQL